MNEDTIYRLKDGRLWDVRNACWVDLEGVATFAEGRELDAQNLLSNLDRTVQDLISASGQSDEAYLIKTLEFYKHPLGELATSSVEGIKRELESLDEEYLTPRTLAGLSTGDSGASTRWAEHEEKAAPLREKLRELETTE